MTLSAWRDNALLRAVSLVIAVLLACMAAAMAQPACNQSHAGARICMVGQACTCEYDRGGQLTGHPPGWRWTCGLLQTCEADPPAMLGYGDAGQQPPVVLEDPVIQWNGQHR